MTGRSGRIAMTAMIAFTIAGCFKHTYEVAGGSPRGTVVYESWRHHWIAGLVSPEHQLHVDDVCPSGRWTIENEWTFLNGVVTMLTGGIYAPTTVRVLCDNGRNRDFDLDEGEIEAMVSDPIFLDWVEAVVPERLDEVVAAQAVQ